MTPRRVGRSPALPALAFVGHGRLDLLQHARAQHVLLARTTASASQADYEKRYKALAQLRRNRKSPRPTCASISIPDEQRARIAGTLSLVNATGQPITDLYVVLSAHARDAKIAFSVPGRAGRRGAGVRWHHYVLAHAAWPRGATMDFRFDLEYGAQGFRNDGADPIVLAQRHVPQSRA